MIVEKKVVTVVLTITKRVSYKQTNKKNKIKTATMLILLPENNPKRGALFGRLTLAELKITPVSLHGLLTPPTVVERIISKHRHQFSVCRMYVFVFVTNTAVVPEA